MRRVSSTSGVSSKRSSIFSMPSSKGSAATQKQAHLLEDWEQQKRQIKQRHRRQRKVRLEQAHWDMRQYISKRHPHRSQQVEGALARRKELYAWFKILDDDDSGEISIAELEGPLVSLGFARSREEVEQLIATVDDDGTGEIGFDEFLQMLESGGADNPIIKLYDNLTGNLDPSHTLSTSTLIAKYRRKVLYGGLVDCRDDNWFRQEREARARGDKKASSKRAAQKRRVVMAMDALDEFTALESLCPAEVLVITPPSDRQPYRKAHYERSLVSLIVA